MTRACALKGGAWLQEKVNLGKRLNDLTLPELEGLAVAVITEFVLQLALEGRNAETEAVPVRDSLA